MGPQVISLLYPQYTPAELRELAKSDGVARLLAINDQREVKRITADLRVDFGHGPRAEEQIRDHLKEGLTAGLCDKRRVSDRRLISASRNVLSPAQHEKLMAEIEGEVPGWCRDCGTMPEFVGCARCQLRHRSLEFTTNSALPF